MIIVMTTNYEDIANLCIRSIQSSIESRSEYAYIFLKHKMEHHINYDVEVDQTGGYFKYNAYDALRLAHSELSLENPESLSSGLYET